MRRRPLVRTPHAPSYPPNTGSWSGHEAVRRRAMDKARAAQGGARAAPHSPSSLLRGRGVLKEERGDARRSPECRVSGGEPSVRLRCWSDRRGDCDRACVRSQRRQRLRRPMSIATPRPCRGVLAAPVSGTPPEVTVVDKAAHAPAGGVIWLSSSVSAAPRASARPLRMLAPVVIVTLASAIRLPWSCDAVPRWPSCRPARRPSIPPLRR